MSGPHGGFLFVRRKRLAELETDPPNWCKDKPEALAGYRETLTRLLALAEGAD